VGLKGYNILWLESWWNGIGINQFPEYAAVSRTDRQSVEEWSNNRVILWNDILNYLGE